MSVRERERGVRMKRVFVVGGEGLLSDWLLAGWGGWQRRRMTEEQAWEAGTSARGFGRCWVR